MPKPATPKRPRREPAAGRKVYARSRVSNGTDILPDVRDGRSLIARRYRDVCSQIVADQGGSSECGEARQQLIRRFSAACCLAESLESRLANGEQIDVSEWCLLASTASRLASRIGIERRAKPVPDLQQYLRGLREQEAAE